MQVAQKAISQKNIKDRDQAVQGPPAAWVQRRGGTARRGRRARDHGRSRAQARGSVDGAAARRGEQNRDGAASPTCLYVTCALCAAVMPCFVHRIEIARPVRPASVGVLVCACVHVCVCVCARARACVWRGFRRPPTRRDARWASFVQFSRPACLAPAPCAPPHPRGAPHPARGCCHSSPTSESGF